VTPFLKGIFCSEITFGIKSISKFFFEVNSDYEINDEAKDLFVAVRGQQCPGSTSVAAKITSASPETAWPNSQLAIRGGKQAAQPPRG